jgi:ribosomal protein L7/L12
MATIVLEIAAVIITIVVFLVVADVASRMRERRARESGLYPPPGSGSQADVERLIAAGETMLAVKLYREIHHVGLKDAKEAVDNIRSRMEPR